MKMRPPITNERREALRKEAEAHSGFKRPYSFLDPAELLQLLDEAEDLAAYQLRLQKGNAHLAFEIARRDEVLGWLRENMPRALELCPYKLGGDSVSREARPVEVREPDGGDFPFQKSPPEVSESGASVVRPSEPLAGSQAGSNGPSGSPTPDSDRDPSVAHKGGIRMVLGGPNKGQWIGYCTVCDWHVGPRPLDHTLGEEVERHERFVNIDGIYLPNTV